jgi:hypothetical protein
VSDYPDDPTAELRRPLRINPDGSLSPERFEYEIAIIKGVIQAVVPAGAAR